jgi:hypothetical protein
MKIVVKLEDHILFEPIFKQKLILKHHSITHTQQGDRKNDQGKYHLLIISVHEHNVSNHK